MSGKLQKMQFLTNETLQLYVIVGHGPYWRFPSGWCASTGGWSDKEQRLNGNLHVIIPHPETEHKDCIVCCKRNVAGVRRETTYVCEICDCKPGLYLGTQWNCKL